MKNGEKVKSLNRFQCGGSLTLFLMLFFAANAMAQQTISGTVTDAQSGETLPGVNILVKGTSTGTSTDAEGQYELSVESLQDTLVLSFIGYQTTDVPIQGRTEISIAMQSQAITGEEMVVVGYGTQRRKNLTGSVSQIESEDLETRAVNNTVQALQGLAPNLNISQTEGAGASDASMNLNIRGTGSLSGSAPYILIDGARATQSELSAMNPDAIKNISVLKDAAASAIYGAHAAYGVILVETKNGARNQDFTIEYSNNIRFEGFTNAPKEVSSVQFAQVANEAAANYGSAKLYPEEQIQRMRDYIAGDIKNMTAVDPDIPNAWLGIQNGDSDGWQSGYANTDWWDVMFKDTKIAQKHTISLSGGSDNMTYYISGNLLNDPGQLRYGDENESYAKYNLNSNIEADITDNLKISNITRYSQEENTFPNSLSGAGQRWRMIHDIHRFSPMAPYKTPAIEDGNGNIIVPEQFAQNAAFNEYNGFNRYSVNNLLSTIQAELDIYKNLSAEGDFTFKRRWYDRTFNYKKWTLLGPNEKSSINFQQNTNQIEKEYRKTEYYSFNIRARYTKTIRKDHNLKLLAGYQQEENNVDNLVVSQKNVILNTKNSTDVATGDVLGPDNPMSTFSTIGTFGRFQYNYMQKYLIEFNGRYDGSSKFASSDRFVFSPSMSVGYNIHEEDYWDPLKDYINQFKLRASYGKLGNQEVGSYLYVSTLPIYNRLNWALGGERPSYTSAPGISSPNITWETSTTLNIGTDLAFLDNRLSVVADVYRRDTDNMFGPLLAVPSVLGTSPPETNSASLRTKGWELTLGWQDQVSNDFSYNLKLMVSDNQTTITSYNNPNKVINDYYEGQELGEIWGYEADKLFQSEKEVQKYLSKVDLSFLGTAWQSGNVKYKDLNGDGKVDAGNNTVNNPGDRKVIGNRKPRYQFSLQVGASWKNFNFSMFWQGIGKRDVWIHENTTQFWGWNRDAHTSISPASLDYWSGDNRDGYLPIPLVEDGRAGFSKDRHPSTRYLRNGAYARLKSLQIGYTLPSSLVQRVNMKRVKIFVNGRNLYTISNVWQGIDPELVNISGGHGHTGKAYPLARTYGLGVSVSF